MKKFYGLFLGVAVVALFIFCGSKLAKPKYSNSQTLAGTMMVCYYTHLNARSEPGNGEVVGSYELHDRIRLTGKIAEFFFWEEDGKWYETEDGNWVTSEALLPLDEYQKRFGR